MKYGLADILNLSGSATNDGAVFDDFVVSVGRQIKKSSDVIADLVDLKVWLDAHSMAEASAAVATLKQIQGATFTVANHHSSGALGKRAAELHATAQKAADSAMVSYKTLASYYPK